MIAYGAAELAASYLTVRKNTLVIANEIPDDKYDFVYAPGMRTVAHQLKHIAYGHLLYDDFHRAKRLTTFKGYPFDEFSRQRAEKERVPMTKAQIVALLKSEGDRVAQWLGSCDEGFLNETFTDAMGQNPKTRFENLLAIKEHEMHCRAQLMVIQRMLGLVPHLTREREERVRQRAAAALSSAKTIAPR